MVYFQEIVSELSAFWSQHDCIIVSPYDVEKGAGTSNPATLLRALGPEPFRAAYIEPCRRPKDGRYAKNPNRLQHYFQFQTILKPSPDDIVDLYIDSLKAIGLDLSQHDIRFVHDDWENPTVGAWGLGWEVWLNGMEVTQFTYFQAAAGLSLPSVTGELTYGVERIAMYLQNVDSIFDVKWNKNLTYGEIYKQNEIQWSHYNFESQDDKMWMRHFGDFKQEAQRLLALDLPIPAYDFVLKTSHAFNMLDAKGVISVSERASYIAEIRELAKGVALGYVQLREELGYPLLKTKEPQKTIVDEKPISPLSSTETFLLEIGTEELPATFVPIGIQQLSQNMEKFLKKEGFSFSSLSCYGAPRRLAIVIENLSTKKKATTTEKKGPHVDSMWNEQGELTSSGQGFLKSIHLAPCTRQAVENNSIAELTIKTVRSKSYVFASIHTSEISTADILQKALPSLITSLEFPKMMHWGDHTTVFARPIRWILSLFGSQTIPFHIEHIQSGRHSMGHRQLHQKRIEFNHANEYIKKLEDAYVLVDQNRRKDRLLSEINKIEKETALRAVHKEKVLAQLIHLSEWPQAAVITFNPTLLEAPKEILISEMVEHQKYIPLVDSDDNLSNQFIIVADNHPTDMIKQGNVKVLSARLSDGSFLWHEECKTALSSLRERLQTIVYQRDLGTVWQKTERLEMLCQSLHPYIPKANLAQTMAAAQLSKADLASQVVGEFPELQGTIGCLLAQHQKLHQNIALAIKEHWLPQHEEGVLPQTSEGALLALSDKCDTLAGFFAIGLHPTSSSDPYALRRQAIGLIRILFAHKIHFSLHEIFAKTLTLFAHNTTNHLKVVEMLKMFVTTRARGLLSSVPREFIDAVFEIQHDDMYDAYIRIQALQECKKEAFSTFLEVLKRCYGQVDFSLSLSIDETLFEDESEKMLFSTIKNIQKAAQKLIREHNWKDFLSLILELRDPIDTLFIRVKVLADDPIVRQNRLSLLRMAIDLCSLFADGKKLFT